MNEPTLWEKHLNGEEVDVPLAIKPLERQMRLKGATPQIITSSKQQRGLQFARTKPDGRG